MTVYRVVRRLSPGLVLISDAFYGERLWTLRVLRNRRTRGPNRVCVRCSTPLLPGMHAYGPEGNGNDRAARLCPTCVDAALCSSS